jgi:hypothetical protein
MRHLPSLLQSISLSMLLPLGLAIAPAQAQSMAGSTCRYNPKSGKPNPLGMRAFVSLTEKDGDTTVTYEQFPSNVGGTVPATIASKRMLFFPKLTIAKARQLMLKDPKYYNELLVLKAESFAAMNAVLICDAATAMEPGSEPVTTAPAIPDTKPVAIAQLPDGNYRFWSGTPTKAVLSSDELLKLGGALALIHKKGNQVTAGFGYIDSDFTACVAGTVSGDRVTGQAFPSEGLTNKATEFINFGPAKFLMVRNPKTIAGKKAYSEAVLDLSGFSRINLGDRAPRKSCS